MFTNKTTVTLAVTAIAGGGAYAVPAHASGSTSNSPGRQVIVAGNDQAYFWTDQWQELEREFEADRAAGSLITSDSVDALIADLTFET